MKGKNNPGRGLSRRVSSMNTIPSNRAGNQNQMCRQFTKLVLDSYLQCSYQNKVNGKLMHLIR